MYNHADGSDENLWLAVALVAHPECHKDYLYIIDNAYVYNTIYGYIHIYIYIYIYICIFPNS